jgi:plastocyanin
MGKSVSTRIVLAGALVGVAVWGGGDLATAANSPQSFESAVAWPPRVVGMAPAAWQPARGSELPFAAQRQTAGISEQASAARSSAELALERSAPVQKPVSAEQKPAPTTAEVKVDNFSFGPAQLTVAVGTTVTWTNRDDIPHTVVSTDKVFKSKVMDTDEKFSFTFSQAGTYPYFCSIHPKMTGTVVVQ